MTYNHDLNIKGHSSLMTAAGRACKSVAQQEEPAKAWRSSKSLQKRGAAGRACNSVAQQAEPARAWRSRKSLQKRGAAERACKSMAQQAWRRRKSLHKHGTAREPRQAWRAKITLSIIGGLGNNISGETTINHNHLERIDTADETASQYKAYDAIHLSENADEQKLDKTQERCVWQCISVLIINNSKYRSYIKEDIWQMKYVHTYYTLYTIHMQHEYTLHVHTLHTIMRRTYMLKARVYTSVSQKKWRVSKER